MINYKETLYDCVARHENDYSNEVVLNTDRQLGLLSVSIIASCFDQEKIIPMMLDAWAKQDVVVRNSEKVQLILVNDGSKDNTDEIVKEIARNLPFNFVYIKQPEHNESHALNTGLILADGEIVFLTNTDTIQIPSTLSSHLQLQTRSKYSVGLGFRMHIMPEELNNLNSLEVNSLMKFLPPTTKRDNKDGMFLSNYFNGAVEDRSIMKTSGELRLFHGWQRIWNRDLTECVENHSLSVRREILLKIGGMDEEMLEWGIYDQMLGAKLMGYGEASGNPIFMVPLSESIGYHPWHGPTRYGGDYNRKIQASEINLAVYEKRKRSPISECLDPWLNRSYHSRNYRILEKHNNFTYYEQSI